LQTNGQGLYCTDSMKILIADKLPNSATELLRNEGWSVDSRSGRPLAELKADIADVHGLIIRSATTVDANLIALAHNLRVIGRAGTGVDNVDLDAASARGILVINSPEATSISVAEHACALMLSLARSIALADAQMKDGKWEKKSLQGVELRGKTLGIVGLGRIGREVTRRARAFQMKLIAHDPFISSQIATDLDAELVSLDDLCARADYITLHVPSTAETNGLFDRERLATCKPGVRIINTARGNLIEEHALHEALVSGHVAGAGLDVFQDEPPVRKDLVGLPQVVATPHISASTREAQELVGVEIATCVRDFLRSGIVRNAVNFPSVSYEEFRHLQPYLTLAEKLGSLLSQIEDERIEGVGVRYYGELAGKSHEMLVGAVLVGLFRPMLSSSITLVNARNVAEQRGLEIIESHSSRARNFPSLLSVKLHTNKGERWAEGAVFEPGKPRLVLLDGVEIEAPLEGSLLVIRNNDQPGVIGEVGTILGRHKINIATFALGREISGAIGLVNIESSLGTGNKSPETVLDELRKIKAVQSASLVNL
jgi:D-3-phosphoglycerate dehydrogenase